MVGHTGVYEAISKAVTAVDGCVKAVVEAAQKGGYDILIIADHGNADYAVNEDGSANTAHSLNPVPCIYVSENKNIKITQRYSGRRCSYLIVNYGAENSIRNDWKSINRKIIAIYN